MKICHVTSAHSRYDTRIFYKECISLAENGYDVYLIVNDDNEDEIKSNVKICSTGFAPKSRKERMLNSLNIIKKKCMEIDADVYHLHDPELLPTIHFLNKKNKKVIFDSHEDYISTICDKEWIPNYLRKAISTFFKIYEKTVIKKIDAAIVCYHWTKERYDKYLPVQNVELIMNYPKMKNEGEFIQPEFLEDCVSYAGNLSKQWCHDSVIKALSNLKNVKYIIAGDMSNEYCMDLKKLEGWKCVESLGRINQDEVEEKVYRKSFAGMALLDYITQCKGNIGNLSNTKFFEYMKAGIPVICTDFVLWKKIVDEEKCGICVNPHDIYEVQQAIKKLYENRDLARKMGLNGRKAIKDKYNWENECEKLLNIYKRISQLNGGIQND